MTLADILSAITTVGFPIVMCGGLSLYIVYTHNHHRNDMLKLNEQHKMETDALAEAINNNTLVIQCLLDKVNKEVSKLEH